MALPTSSANAAAGPQIAPPAAVPEAYAAAARTVLAARVAGTAATASAASAGADAADSATPRRVSRPRSISRARASRVNTVPKGQARIRAASALVLPSR
jgi:hypothetical protein